MKTRYFALVVGIIYLVIGIAGFIPAFGSERTTPELTVEANYQDLFGLFPINVLHNLVHLLVGALGVLAYMSFDAARNYSRGLAIVYAVLAIMGLIDAGDLNTTFDLIPLFSHDIWLHALTAAVAAYFGFGNVDAGETREQAPAA
ncbi:MAG TPA: DUF4383 domain-containing protein [Thermomicrobiales bacterium]|nr:DUF4383 domain-containing protein [Thermomicrobiales bacterium]